MRIRNNFAKIAASVASLTLLMIMTLPAPSEAAASGMAVMMSSKLNKQHSAASNDYQPTPKPPPPKKRPSRPPKPVYVPPPPPPKSPFEKLIETQRYARCVYEHDNWTSLMTRQAAEAYCGCTWAKSEDDLPAATITFCKLLATISERANALSFDMAVEQKQKQPLISATETTPLDKPFAVRNPTAEGIFISGMAIKWDAQASELSLTSYSDKLVISSTTARWTERVKECKEGNLQVADLTPAIVDAIASLTFVVELTKNETTNATVIDAPRSCNATSTACRLDGFSTSVNVNADMVAAAFGGRDKLCAMLMTNVCATIESAISEALQQTESTNNGLKIIDLGNFDSFFETQPIPYRDTNTNNLQ